ncbi:MAG: chemotaxis response regulator protein-glutamate methylesterase [Gammaproteobacteria bacterium]|nr:chemotaxis response regulator protein-glutamate methylesterase [Gammaproteobacteria bacterium]
MSKIRVLVVDDSALMRTILSELLNSDPEIEVVGTAMDAYAARDKIKALNPDVLTLDIEMPKMDGLSFLSNLMRLRPMPVVMVSSLTEKGAAVTMQALNLGAVDFVSKPKIDLAHSIEDYALEITDKVKAAAVARIGTLLRNGQRPDGLHKSVSANHPKAVPAAGRKYSTTDKIIAIGASTGGTEAIKEVLVAMQPDCPGVVITQHIPPVFSRSFAKRMNQCSSLIVCEAEDGQAIRPGHAFVAPGDRHLLVVSDGAHYRCKLDDGPLVNRHKPAVDVLFDSVAENVAGDAVGIILTGMGRDGAKGLRRMHESGAETIAQDEQSSVVWGMPKAAVEEGGVDRILPLEQIAENIMETVRRQSR